MNMNQSKQFLRNGYLAFPVRGFGYAVLQGDNWLIDYGKKIINKDKNVRVLV